MYEDDGLPEELAGSTLVRRALPVALVLAALILIALLAPGLAEVRRRLSGADPGWLAAGVLLEALSCASYVVMFRPVFSPRMSWRLAGEISAAELGVGSLVPTSGVAGLALGGWVLHRGGMPADRVARRSVAFFVLKSGVNFVAVVVLGLLLAVGLIGPPQPWWLTIVPALGAALVIVLVVLAPRVGPGPAPPADASRTQRALSAVRSALVRGGREGLAVARRPRPSLLAGAVGYWIFDNAVLWASYHAVGVVPPASVVLMGYLIGQLGGALPLPGGVGGIDLGLVGTLVAYGAPAAPTAAAVLAYRLILFWLPLGLGVLGAAGLRARLRDPAGFLLESPAVSAAGPAR
ncbi:MAG TPA: lysylphosphatidylglycerol synthase transmembrane domain-containing protein [Solirubrobacteraceae bacterium]|nr:lysylphosphatidylglycerol synthase transmembrane domain-containing protein [Solirubrobacteraceae bacterium]